MRPKKPKLCACGCGEFTSGIWNNNCYPKYTYGHHLRGKKSPWTTKRMKENNPSTKPENRQKSRERMLGLYKKGILINKGKNHPMFGVHRYGEDNPMYGKKRPDTTKRNLEDNPSKRLGVGDKISKTNKRLFKEGKRVSPNKGKILSEKTKKKSSTTKKRRYKEGKIKLTGCAKLSKENPTWHPNFNNYSSFEPYGKEFNKELKEQISKRDNYRCQQCFRHQDELFIKRKNRKVIKSKLDIHHIDFNKKNNNPNNLISLCRVCHSQTQLNREGWINYFQNKMNGGGL